VEVEEEEAVEVVVQEEEAVTLLRHSQVGVLRGMISSSSSTSELAHTTFSRHSQAGVLRRMIS
jgi:hypothetical protein